MLALVVVLFGATAGMIAPSAASAQTGGSRVGMDALGMPEKTFFPETGHHLSGPLLKAWNRTGLMIFGYPISEPMTENGRTVQYFERARLEVWPQYAGTEWEVQGTLLGNWVAEEKYRTNPAFRRLPANTIPDSQDRVFFSETGHSLAYGFKKYWEANGGLWQFGYPISEEFSENGFTVQYFERARFEWRPENQGTEFEVLLGRLGDDYAREKKIETKPVAQAQDAVQYDIGLYEDSYSNAFRNGDGSWWGFVSTDAVSVRSEPKADGPVLDILYNRRPIQIRGIVRGDLREATDAWYDLGGGRYVPATYVDPLVLRTPPQTFSGRWVDVNLTQFYAVTYEGNQPKYVAIIAAGRGGRTPTGVFNIQYQVRSEIMDSATVGIPKGDPEYYYLENVEYTQYFLEGGYAIHGNYWTPEDRFGNFTSNGCVGLMNEDAAVFWDWLNPGDVVSIHF